MYAQPLVTLTLSTRTPTSSWCTYEQKDDGDSGVTKALNSPARSGDAHKIRSAAAMRASRAPRGDAIFRQVKSGFRTLSEERYSETYRRDTLRKSGDETPRKAQSFCPLHQARQHGYLTIEEYYKMPQKLAQAEARQKANEYLDAQKRANTAGFYAVDELAYFRGGHQQDW